MKLTSEQYDIVHAEGNIKVNAVAGSGKTSTLIAYAKARPKNPILYLAFNRSAKLDAEGKFAASGLRHVRVETAHSLAYRHIVSGGRYRVRHHGYRLSELAETLGFDDTGDPHAKYVLANHVRKFLLYFCNSDKPKISDLNYLDTVADYKAKTFVGRFYNLIAHKTRYCLSLMDKGDLAIIPDFYLKKFQLSSPHLPYDCLLFDEGQDASEVMLDIFDRQSGVKALVGDTNQQIYSWRYAVNSLEKSDYARYNLTCSFRFEQPIADLAREYVRLKKYLGQTEEVILTGAGQPGGIKTRAVLARTNLGLLHKAILYVTGQPNPGRIYFEGNIHSYTYAADGTSLYDVLHLYNQQHRLIQDPLIRGMRNFDDLQDYIDKTEDVELAMMVDLVYEFRNEVPDLIQAVKECHVDGDRKEKADVIFSTVHRSKGLEYDAVQMAEDFLTEEKLVDIFSDPNQPVNRVKLGEEINLLYVAATRAKTRLYVPETLLPKEFAVPPSSHISVIRDAESQTRLAIMENR